MIENIENNHQIRKFNVRVEVAGHPKIFSLAAPVTLDISVTARAFREMIRSHTVQESLVDVDEDCDIKILTSRDGVVGITVPDKAEDKV